MSRRGSFIWGRGLICRAQQDSTPTVASLRGEAEGGESGAGTALLGEAGFVLQDGGVEGGEEFVGGDGLGKNVERAAVPGRGVRAGGIGTRGQQHAGAGWADLLTACQKFSRSEERRV